MVARRDYRKTPRQQVADEAAQADADAASPDGGVGRPVEYDSQLAPWRSPQYLPGSPHRRPGIVNRPNISPLLNGGVGAAPGATDPTVINVPQTGIIDPHHYASVSSNNIPVPVTVTQTPFLTAPQNKRNFLALRNPAAVGIVYIDFGQSASANSTIAVGPGQTLLFDEVVPQDDLYCFGSAAGLTISFAYSNI